jgi:hypothetical protein
VIDLILHLADLGLEVVHSTFPNDLIAQTPLSLPRLQTSLVNVIAKGEFTKEMIPTV